MEVKHIPVVERPMAVPPNTRYRLDENGPILTRTRGTHGPSIEFKRSWSWEERCMIDKTHYSDKWYGRTKAELMHGLPDDRPESCPECGHGLTKRDEYASSRTRELE